MNTIDIIFGIILLLGFIQGFKKGLFVELASLVGLIAAVYGAIHFSHIAANWLAERTSWTEKVINLAAFAITFVIIVLIVSLAGKLLTKIANFAMLGIINKMAGAAFAVIKYAFLLSVVIMFLNEANERIGFVSEKAMEESILFSPVKSIAPSLLPSILEKAKEENIYNPDKEENKE